MFSSSKPPRMSRIKSRVIQAIITVNNAVNKTNTIKQRKNMYKSYPFIFIRRRKSINELTRAPCTRVNSL